MNRYRMILPAMCIILLTCLFCLTSPASVLEDDREVPELAVDESIVTGETTEDVDPTLLQDDGAADDWIDEAADVSAFEWTGDAAFEWADEAAAWEDTVFAEEDALFDPDLYEGAIEEETEAVLEEESEAVLEEESEAEMEEAEETVLEAADDGAPFGNDLHWKYVSSTGTLVISGTSLPWETYTVSRHPNFHDYYKDKIFHIVVEEGLREIPNYFFYDMRCVLDVSLPSTMEKIGEYAFANCPFLRSLTLPSGCKEIKVHAFENCKGLKSISLPDNLQTIGARAFQDCVSLTSISLPDSVTNLGLRAFSGDISLSSVKLPAKLTQLELCTFEYCSSLKQVTFPTDLNAIEAEAFKGCISLSSVTLPASLKTISSAFSDCVGLKEAVFSGTLDTLDTNAFTGCISLQKVTFNGDLNNMGDYTFRECYSLKEIRCLGVSFIIKSNAFDGIPAADVKKIVFAGFKGSDIESVANNVGQPFKELFYMSSASVTGLSDMTYTGKAICPVPVVNMKNATLNNGTDYSLSYHNNAAVGTATVTITGKDNYIGSISRTFKIVPNEISSASVSGLSDMTYTGKAICPVPVVNMKNATLNNGTDYSLSYHNNTVVGTATVNITGKGIYTGSISRTFKIVPKGTSLSKLTKGSKQIKVKWKKNTKQVTGYQIQYSPKSDFSGAKTIKVKGAKKTSKTIKKLKAKKKYYVRIRTYKTVGSTNYCSAWSKSKSITTK